MDLNLRGKSAIVTGGASGIGRSTAHMLATEGAHVVVADLSSAGRQTVAEITESGGNACFIPVDVTDPSSVSELVDKTVTMFGSLDCAVNAVGIPQGSAPVHETPVDEFDHVLAVNVRGTFLSMRYEIPAMLNNGGGSIVNLTSIAGLTAAEGTATYAATKHAVLGLTRGAAMDYARHGIRVNAVAPGTIDTPMLDVLKAKSPTVDVSRESLASSQPVGRLGHPDEIASAIVWLLSDASSFVVGAPLIADGGYTAR